MAFLLHSNLTETSGLIDGFSILFNENWEAAYFNAPPCRWLPKWRHWKELDHAAMLEVCSMWTN